MDKFANIVLVAELIVLVTEVDAYATYPKRMRDVFQFEPPHHQYRISNNNNNNNNHNNGQFLAYENNKQRRNHRPIAYQVVDHYHRSHHQHPGYVDKTRPLPVANPVVRKPRPKEYPPQQWPQQALNTIEEASSHNTQPDNEAFAPPAVGPGSFTTFGQDNIPSGRLYKKPGEWAIPHKNSGINLGFVPIQTYAQVRNTNTVKHVPKSEAYKDATSYEEILNAPRLKELLRTKKLQEVYSEEGYEDAGYDHAGHERHAEHGEAYVKKEDEEHGEGPREPLTQDDDSVNNESRNVHNKRLAQDIKEEKMEPKITITRTETSSMAVEYAKSPERYKGAHKYSSKIKDRKKKKDKSEGFEFTTTNSTFPSVLDEISTESSIVPLREDFIIIPPKTTTPRVVFPTKQKSGNKTSKYRSYSKSFGKPSNKTSKYSSGVISLKETNSSNVIDGRQEKNATKPQRLYTRSNSTRNTPKNSKQFKKSASYKEKAKDHKEKEQVEHKESEEKRIVLPTIGYINSLTTAHFGKDDAKNEEKGQSMMNALKLTEALYFQRLNQIGVKPWVGEDNTAQVVQPFEPMKLQKPSDEAVYSESKREIQNATDRQDRLVLYDQHDDVEGENAHDDKNEEIKEDERQRLEQERLEKEKYEKDLSEEITKQEKEVLQQTFSNLGIYGEEISKGPASTSKPYEEIYWPPTTPPPVNTRKYPFYFSKSISRDSPLRYATHPNYFPRKSGHRMEFYESRDRMMQCPDVDVDLEDIPKANSTEDMETQPGEKLRITGLGDKITCLKMKYFDEDPLDSPFFREKEIDPHGKSSIREEYKSTPVNNNNNNHKKNSWSSRETKIGSSEIFTKNTAREASTFLPTPVAPFISITTTTQAPVINESFRFHSLYEYHPNKTVKIFIRDQKPAFNNIEPTIVKYEINPNETASEESKEYQLQYRGNKTKTFPKDRVIPVKEPTDERPVNYYIKPVSYIARPKYPQVVHRQILPLVKPTAPVVLRNRITLPDNCKPIISRMAVLEGLPKFLVDCKETIFSPPNFFAEPPKIVKLIPAYPELRKPEIRFRPVASRKPSNDSYINQSDWVPVIVPYASSRSSLGLKYWTPKTVMKRKSDEVVLTQNDTTTDANDQLYVIDELKEDETVRQGEVIEDINHLPKLMEDLKAENLTKEVEEPEMNSTTTETLIRRKRQVSAPETNPSNSKLLHKKLLSRTEDNSTTVPAEIVSSTESATLEIQNATARALLEKRQLTRLSGRDFLVRYHKNKGKAKEGKKSQVDDFWKVKNLDTLEARISRSDIPNKLELTRVESGSKAAINSSSGNISDQFNHPTLYYFTDEKTGKGTWLADYEEETKSRKTEGKEGVAEIANKKVISHKLRKILLKKKPIKDAK